VRRTLWWWVVGVIAVSILAADIVTGPYIQFPILFVIPVGLGAWYLNRGAGIISALVLVGCRFGIAITLEENVIPDWAAAVNAGIRLIVLVGLAVLLVAAREKRALALRVHILEGILPICSFCKKIRRPDGVWEQIETYVSNRSDARFSHSFCEACGRKHYGEYVTSSDSKDAEPGAAPDRGGQ